MFSIKKHAILVLLHCVLKVYIFWQRHKFLEYKSIKYTEFSYIFLLVVSGHFVAPRQCALFKNRIILTVSGNHVVFSVQRTDMKVEVLIWKGRLGSLDGKANKESIL